MPLEPFVLVAGMVGDKVQNELHVQVVDGIGQVSVNIFLTFKIFLLLFKLFLRKPEVVQRPENRVHVSVVRNVVAKVLHGTLQSFYIFSGKIASF